LKNLSLGISYSLTILVGEKDSARHFGSGLLDVYSTPAMIALMERTSMEMIQPLLDDGYGTVGVSVNIKHIRATPVGAKVKCNSLLNEISGNRLVFKVEARDDNGMIGEGIHERYIIDETRFLNKLNKS